MKLHYHLIIAITLLSLPACEQTSDGNHANGMKDAVGARPYEDIRDAAEEAGDAVKDAGRNIRSAVGGS